jgi:tetratricopeptide (TPR) repeat protein
MRILIVDDSEQPSAAPHAPAGAKGNGHTQTDVFAAFSFPEITMSRLTRVTRTERSAAKQSKSDDPASLHLENSPEVKATLLNALGLAYLANGRFDEAEGLVEQALELRVKLYGRDHPLTGDSINCLARVLRDSDRLDEALERVRDALGIHTRLGGGDSLPVAADLSVLASIQFQRSELTDAEQAARAALRIFDEKLHGSDPWVPYVLDLLARLHQYRAEYSRASEMYERLLQTNAKLYGRDHAVYAVCVHNYATVLEAAGKLDAARARYDEAIAILEQCTDEYSPNLIDALSNRGSLSLAQGDLDRAEQDYQEALERDRAIRGPDHTFVGYDLMNLARLSLDRQDIESALTRLDEALDIFNAKLPKNHVYIGAALTLKGAAQVQANRPAEAEAPLRDAIRLWAGQLGERSVEFAIARANLARAWFLQGTHHDEVVEVLRNSLAIVVAIRGEHDKTAIQIREWLKEAGGGEGDC